MAQSISRGSIRAYPFVRTAVPAPDSLEDLPDALASMVRIVAGRRLSNRHEYSSIAPTVHVRGSLPPSPPLEAAARHKDAVARITTQ